MVTKVESERLQENDSATLVVARDWSLEHVWLFGMLVLDIGVTLVLLPALCERLGKLRPLSDPRSLLVQEP